jgi:hypothetical protein
LITLGGLALTRDGAPYAGAAESITSAGTNLALNPAVVSSDLTDFENATADRTLEQAAALYQGPFLDGFSLDDAPDFERKLASARASNGRPAGAMSTTT